MKTKFNDWPVILITAVVGVLFIIWHGKVNLFDWLVRGLGVLILIPGICVLVHSLNVMQGRRRVRAQITFDGKAATTGKVTALSMLIAASAAIALGFWMLIHPGFFVGLIAYMFAAALLIYGIYQFALLIYLRRPVVMPWYFYIVPSLFVLAGFSILLTSVRTINSVVTLMTGILLVAGAVNTLIRDIAERSMTKRLMLGGGNDGSSPE